MLFRSTTTTDAGGAYAFADRVAGDHWVTYGVQSGWTNIGTRPIRVTLAWDSAQPSGKDFFVRQSNLVISGEVSEDTDASGGINGAEGVLSLGTPTVTLYRDANGNASYDDGAETLVATDDATFSFTDLVPDTYFVVETNPSGLVSTNAVAGTVGVVQTSDRIRVVLVDADSTGNAFLDAPSTSSIAGKVWSDRDGDGSVDVTFDAPGASPTTTQVVLALTDPGDLPPRALIAASASSRE